MVALGKGQGERAKAIIKEGQYRGDWVFLQNCHLVPDWLPELENIIEK